ncbi:hypothetical protein [Streptomyces sp. 3214.6]|uniref:hypothetical protein n=1 Tax=Streptomyces sp. 3214.6 TaxID=1882757 RepID=UPI0009A75E32
MANGANALLVGRRRRVPASGPGRSWRPRGHRLLAAVAGAFTLADLVAALAALALAGHLAVQYAVLDHTVDRTTKSHRDWTRAAARLHRLGVRPPCLLTGHEAVPVAFCTGCTSAGTSGHDADTTEAAILRTVRRMPTAVLTAREHRAA